MKRHINPLLGLVPIFLLSFSPAAADSALSTPGQLQANPSNDGLRLSWTPPPRQGIKGYLVYVKRPGSDELTLITARPVTDTSANFKHLKTGQEYEFAVSAVDANDVESPQNLLKVTAPSPVLSAPQGFKAEVLDSGIQLTWDQADPEFISGFNLYLAPGDGKPARKLTAEPFAGNEVTLSKLKRDKAYGFYLTALSQDGREGPPTQVLQVQYSSQRAGATTNAPAVTVAAAVSRPSAGNSAGSFYLGLGGGIDLPAQNWQSAYKLGPGGKLTAGYAFNGSLSVQLDAIGFYFSGTNYSGPITDLEVILLPTLHYYFAGQGIRPYLLAGAGVDLEFLSAKTGSGTLGNLDAVAGAGVEATLSERASVFAEGKFNVIFFSETTARDVPVSAGVRFGL